jgi:hypothetical protein
LFYLLVVVDDTGCLDEVDLVQVAEHTFVATSQQLLSLTSRYATHDGWWLTRRALGA